MPSLPLAKRLEAIKNLPEEDRLENLRGVYNEMLQKRGLSAMDEVLQLKPEEVQEVAPNMISELVQYDPKRAAEVIPRLPEKAQERAMYQLMDNWLKLNFRSAREWLDQQPAGQVKDHGISRLISNIGNTDPEAAVSWALQLSKEELRLQQVKNTVRDWAGRDQKGAQLWVERHQMPENVRQELVKAIAPKTEK